MSFKNTLLPIQTTLQSRGRLLDLQKPAVMGILNATPDSFYNKGRNSAANEIVEQAGKMLEDGATILDIGGVSTRPNAEKVSTQEEMERVIPVIEAVHKAFPDAWLSIDTYQSEVAKQSVAAGASIINDVSSGELDNDMLQIVASLKVPYIAMHMQGTPQTMQQNPHYSDVVTEVRNYLADKYQQCKAAGIRDIIIDAGFGFGKTVEHNFQLLQGMHTLRMVGVPILAGLSRKSMVCRTLGVSPENALNGTTALHMLALQQGASILRAHDVKEAVEVTKLYEAYSSAG